jgi:L-threonylcarbamoyladenylate synthase
MSAPSLARIYRGTPRNLRRLATVLQQGGIVGVPTETVYGLAANALDATACMKIFHAKGRPTEDPLIVHVHSLKEWNTIAQVNDAALRLARTFWPGPLTIILPKKPIVPEIVSAGLPSVAVRIPAHPLFRRLLKLAGLPIAAPSANPFGYVSPTTAEHVRSGLGREIRYILDGGPSDIGLESTIIDLRTPRQPVLLRPGAITAEQISKVLGLEIALRPPKIHGTRAQIAPGLMARHYSPHTPVVLHERMPTDRAADQAWVFVAKPPGRSGSNVFWLDPTGKLGGAARRLFGILRQLDQARFTVINIEIAKGGGLALAINDRLKRAAAR